MMKIFLNYVAMGEITLEWVVSTYFASVKRIYCLAEAEPELIEADKATIDIIERSITDDKLAIFLPHSNVDSDSFLKLLRTLADEEKYDLNVTPVDGVNLRKIWSKLDVTKKKKEELAAPGYFLETAFVQDCCDLERLEHLKDSCDEIVAYMKKGLKKLNAKERKILTYRFGLNGKPCVSIEELCDLFESDEKKKYCFIPELMRMERDAFLKLYFADEKRKEKITEVASKKNKYQMMGMELGMDAGVVLGALIGHWFLNDFLIGMLIGDLVGMPLGMFIGISKDKKEKDKMA